jgi:hypothetical protein
LIAPTERRRSRLAPHRRTPAGAVSPSAHLPSGTRILNKSNNLDAVFAFFSRSHGNTIALGRQAPSGAATTAASHSSPVAKESADANLSTRAVLVGTAEPSRSLP